MCFYQPLVWLALRGGKNDNDDDNDYDSDSDDNSAVILQVSLT